jgi:hypothetical protein
MTSPDFFTCLEHGLVTIPEHLIDDFGKEIQASYRMQEEFIPCNRLMSEAEKVGYQWRSLT